MGTFGLRMKGKLVEEFGIEEFTKSHMKSLMGMFTSYENLWRHFGCDSEESQMEYLKQLSIINNNQDFQNAIEEMFQAEKEWDNFLERLDQQLNHSSKLSQEAPAILDLEVESLESETSTTFQDILTKSDLTWVIFLRHFA